MSASDIGSVLNDAVYEVAHRHRTRIVELRRLMSSTEDYLDSIHPSPRAAAKIAQEIVTVVNNA